MNDTLATLQFLFEREIAGCQRKLMKYHENITKQYETVNWNKRVIMFENFQEKTMQTLVIVALNLCMLHAYQ